MELEPDNTIAGLMALIADLDRQGADAKRVVNILRARRGEAPAFPDDEMGANKIGGTITIKTDQFYRQKTNTAMRGYLNQRKSANIGPATLNEIYAALCDGGFQFESDNEDNRKRNLRFLLSKNTAIFHKMPDGAHFGLADWYPGAKDVEGSSAGKKTKRKGRRGRPKSAKIVVEAGPKKLGYAPDKNSPQTGKRLTQIEAVQAALKAIEGEFTKQDVVSWIEKNHPALNAEQKKLSIFAMLGKLKDEIETVKKGKGAEPSIYRRANSTKA